MNMSAMHFKTIMDQYKDQEKDEVRVRMHWSRTKDALTPLVAQSSAPEGSMEHPIWTEKEAEAVKTDTHFEPRTTTDRAAMATVMALRCTSTVLYKVKDENNLLKHCSIIRVFVGLPRVCASSTRVYRKTFDWASGYDLDACCKDKKGVDESKILARCILLETVAGDAFTYYL